MAIKYDIKTNDDRSLECQNKCSCAFYSGSLSIPYFVGSLHLLYAREIKLTQYDSNLLFKYLQSWIE